MYSRVKLICLALMFVIFALLLAAQSSMTIRCRVAIPEEFKKTPFNPPPNGEPKPVRYTKAYEAFWWNCVSVRAHDLKAHCPLVASGTPAAAAGAGDGAVNADEQISNLLQKHSTAKVRSYLRSLAATNEAKRKMKPYFDSPSPE